MKLQWVSCSFKKSDKIEPSCAYLPPGTPAGHLSAVMRNACGHLYVLGVKHIMEKPSLSGGWELLNDSLKPLSTRAEMDLMLLLNT